MAWWLNKQRDNYNLIPGIDSGSNRNEYQESSLAVKARPARKNDNLTTICEPIV
jgi:hypothetical protein